MSEENILNIKNRDEFRKWLEENSLKEKECWIKIKRGKPQLDLNCIYYIDAVEEAICFGWIDSIQKIINGERMQRFSPRTKYSPWTELNKERARRLIKLGLMTNRGMKVLPKLGERSFQIDKDIETALKKARVWKTFKSFPKLYQKIRVYNVAFYKKVNKEMYNKALNHLIQETKKRNMFGEWNDYGRLIDY